MKGREFHMNFTLTVFQQSSPSSPRRVSDQAKTKKKNRNVDGLSGFSPLGHLLSQCPGAIKFHDYFFFLN